MLTLALESSAKSASAALVEDGKLLAQYSQNTGLTHSRTLLPMARDLLENAERTPQNLDRIAVAMGPGSFTGVRIGVAAVKGLCWALEIPAVGVSTLEAMAWHGMGLPEGSLICCAMDARRNQLYNALFCMENGVPRRLCHDRAISCADLLMDKNLCNSTVFIVGDGANLCYNYLNTNGISATLAPPMLEYQSAWGVAMAAADKPACPAAELLPVYLRLSQAERERQAHL